MDSHLLIEKFRADNEAKIAAAKAFCIANKIWNNDSLNHKQYNPEVIEQIKDIQLPNPYERLNRLKPILPEGFYHLWQGIK